jgi:hypothetical protein
METQEIKLMTNDTNKLDAEDAKNALESIQSLEGAALQHAMPSKWFGIAMAVIVGLMIFLVGSGLRDYYVFPILAIPLIIAIQRSKAKASPKAEPVSKPGLVALSGLLVFFVLLIVVAIVLRTNYGLALAPAICGLIAAITVYFLSNSERKDYQNRIDKGRDK